MSARRAGLLAFMRDRAAICCHPTSRARVLTIICFVSLLGIVGCSRRFADDTVTEHSARHSIDGKAPTIVAVSLPEGVHLVAAREDGIDLRVIVDDGDQKIELTDSVPRHGLHAAVVNVASERELRVELRSTDHRNRRGSAELRIARWSNRNSQKPGTRELGFEAYGRAGSEIAAGNQDSWARAAAALNEAAAHFDQAGDEESLAQAQYTLGHLQYLLRDDRLAAIRAAEMASDAYRSIDDRNGVHNAAVLRAASELEVAAGMNATTQRAEQRALYRTADRRLMEAVEHFTSRELTVHAQYAVNMRGVGALYSGDINGAEKFFSEAERMARANQDDGERLKVLSNLAWVHNQLGFVARAADEYAELMPLIERDRQPALYGAVLNNYGLCLIALGEFDRALGLHTEVLELMVAQGQEFEQARELAALGGLYFRTGDLQRALEALRAAIAVQERIRDGLGQATSLRIAGNAAAALDQHELALQYLRRSAQIDVDPDSVARTRVLIAGELRALRDLRGAEAELAPALASSNALVRAEGLDERGRLRLAQGNPAGAVADLRGADRGFAQLGLDFNRIDTNTALSQALLASDDAAGAVAAADEAISIVSRIRVKSANPEWRAHFLSARYSPFEARIAAEFASRPTNPAAAAWRAFLISEEVRARSLADMLADEAQQQQPQDAEIDALRAQLTSQQLRLEARMSRPDADEAGTLALRRSIVETRARIDAKLAGQKAVAVRNHALSGTLASLQARLPADTAVLSYFVGDAETHVWLVTRNQLKHARLAGRGAMAAYTDAVVSAQRQPHAAGGTESVPGARLVANLLDDVRETRLLIIPDGPLNGMPFAALSLPGGNPGEILIDRFVLGHAPSLALALRNPPARTGLGKQFAVVSDPVYAPDDRRLASHDGGGVLRGRTPAGSSGLTRLPYSAAEARAVTRALGGTAIQISGFDATPARVMQLASEDLGVLHFATHALARSDSPEQSALYLSEFAADGRLIEDARLSVGDITRSRLRADVVVLSGCETGDGSRLRGEGVFGLTYGFLANGSHAVVAALWPIEDATTAKFMDEFYRAYRQTGRTADALRGAQLRTRATTKAAVWASFVVRASGFP